MSKLSRCLALASFLGAAAAATADPAPLHVDAEVDPTAYALSGNSIHVGVGYQRYRLDLGNFALALPQWVHGDDGFDVSFEGYGAKLQVFPFAEQCGLFTGIDAAWTYLLVQRQGTDLAVRRHQLELGVHVGYRISVIDRFYVTPWIGVGYQLGTREVTLADATFQPMRISVFPAIHVGYQFQ